MSENNLQMAEEFINQDTVQIKEEISIENKQAVHCRFCAEFKAKTDVVDLDYDTESLNHYIDVLNCLNVDYVELSWKNNLPKTVCEACSTQLNDSYLFFKKVKQTQLYLKLYYNKKSKTEDEDIDYRNKNTSTDFESDTNDEDCQKFTLNSSKQLDNSFDNNYTEMASSNSDIGTQNNCENSSSNSQSSSRQNEMMVIDEAPVNPKPKRIRQPNHVYRKPRPKIVKEKGSRTMKGSWNLYKWICCHCGLRYDTMDELRSHSKETHNICYGFKCADCQDDFNTFNSFIEHVRRHRLNLRYYCEYCNEYFETQTDCSNHTKTHWEGDEKACDRCGEILPDQSALERHTRGYKRKVIARHSRRKGIVVIQEYNNKYKEPKILKSWTDYEWTCLICCTVMPDVGSLRAHTQQVHNKCFSMKCVDCLLVRTRFNSFVTHVRRHRPLLSKFCQYCNTLIRDPDLMREHIKIHTEGAVPPCDGCGQLFETHDQLKTHVKQFDPPRKSASLTKEDLTCDICDKEFSTIATLRNHKEIHDINREKRFTCNFCGKSFYENTNLKNHMRLHSTKTEECPICHRKFHAKPYLKNHLKTHTDVKPFPCMECGKNFRLKRQMQNHMLTHTDIKPYKCVVCGKEFRVRSQLKVHEVQHTGIMPYTCRFCEREFGNWSNCNKHMIRKHGTPLAKTKRTPHGRVAVESTSFIE